MYCRVLNTPLFLPFLDKINAFVKNAAIIIFKLNLDIGHLIINWLYLKKAFFIK